MQSIRFYPQHFRNSTSHLEIESKVIYFDMMIRYYESERPFTTDVSRILRTISISDTAKNRRVVDDILNEFFVLDKDQSVWRHNRIEREIANYHAKSEKARKSAAHRWVKK